MPRTAALYRALSAGRMVIVWLLTCCVAGRAGMAMAADPVWRCQAAGARAATYQATPCHGSGLPLPAAHTPSTQDRKASRRVAEREARLARSLARQRVQRETRPPPAHASLSGPVRQVSVGQGNRSKAKGQTPSRTPGAHASAQRTRRHDPDVFRAQVPGSARKRAGSDQSVDVVSVSPP